MILTRSVTVVNHSIVEGFFAMRTARIVISLPLVICATQLMRPVSFAQAAAMNPVEATQLLAKANALNVKCKLVSDEQGQGLKDLLARAEISLAEKANVATARKAIATGRAEGKAAACDDSARNLVTDVYAAASKAVSLPVEQVVQTETPESAVAAPDAGEPGREKALAVADEPAPKKVIAEKPVKPKSRQMEKAAVPKKGLGSYAVVAEQYYAALKCGGASAGKLNRMYQVVLAEHKSAMAANKARDVKAMLRAAEARAGSRSCG